MELMPCIIQVRASRYHQRREKQISRAALTVGVLWQENRARVLLSQLLHMLFILNSPIDGTLFSPFASSVGIVQYIKHIGSLLQPSRSPSKSNNPDALGLGKSAALQTPTQL